MSKERWTHTILAVLVAAAIYAVTWMASYEQFKKNVFSVILLLAVVGFLADIYTQSFYSGGVVKEHGKKDKG